MPWTPCAIVVEPAGTTVDVTIKRNSSGGATVDAYTAENGASLHSFPKSVTTTTTFWLASPGSFYVSLAVGTTDVGSTNITLDPFGRGQVSPTIDNNVVDDLQGVFAPKSAPTFTGSTFTIGTTADVRIPFRSSRVLDGSTVGTTGVDVVGHLLATTVQGDFTSMGGPNPGIIFGTNIYTQTTTTSAGAGGITSLYGALIEADVRTPDVTYTNVRGLVAEAAFLGPTAGGTVTNMMSLRVANPKRKDGAVSGTATNAYGLYVDPVATADTGATSAYSVYVVGGTSRLIGNVEINAGAAASVGLRIRLFATSPTGNFLEGYDATDSSRKFRVTKDGLAGFGSQVSANEGLSGQTNIGGVGPGSEAGIAFGSTATVVAYLAAAGIVRFPASLSYQFGSPTTFLETAEPAAPSDARLVIWAKDNGGGKTALMVRFPSGVSQQISVEP